MLATRLRQIFLTPLGTRWSPEKQWRLRGVALLMVMMSLAIMTAVVGDLGYNETIRYKLAIHNRDSLKAEALADGSLKIVGLLLLVQGKLQPMITQFASMGVPLPAYTLWELLPMDSSSVQNLTTGGFASMLGLDVSQALKKREEEQKLAKQNQAFKTTFIPPMGGFGAFEGSFKILIQDEESKITLRGWIDTTDQKRRALTRRLLAALFAPIRYNDLFEGRGAKREKVDRPTLIANIYDYADIDELRIDPYALDTLWGQGGGGSEKEVYMTDRGILPKNAYFDSLDELRLVHGMTTDHMTLFKDSLSIYGEEGGKINILSAKDLVVEALIRFCAANDLDPLLLNQGWVDETVSNWRKYQKQGKGPVSEAGFMSYLQSRTLKLNDELCKSALGSQAGNFTVTSQATVGDVTRTLTIVIRAQGDEKYYFRNN